MSPLSAKKSLLLKSDGVTKDQGSRSNVYQQCLSFCWQVEVNIFDNMFSTMSVIDK